MKAPITRMNANFGNHSGLEESFINVQQESQPHQYLRTFLTLLKTSSNHSVKKFVARFK